MVWEERWHPLRKEWVIIAAHRQSRPWSGGTVEPAAQPPHYAADCYLCPGNRRVNGVENPPYSELFVFDNDHPCVGPHAPSELGSAQGVQRVRRAAGVARVVCYSPRHDVTLAELEEERVLALLYTWREQYLELGARPEVEHVLVFENKGEVVGVSNPHPHCQIYATNFVFKTLEIELAAEEEHLRETGRVLFQDVIESEQRDACRILAENETALAFVPHFARFSYETYVAPKRSCESIADLSEPELLDFARVLKETLVRFDNLWQMSFPYVMVLHQAPTHGRAYPAHHFHVQFHPPLRRPNLLKYLAGPELGGGCFVSDSAPEQAAAELRAVSTRHYRLARLPLARGLNTGACDE